MFDIGSSELLLIIIVAIVVIGPKDLPRALYKLGQVVGKAKAMARHFRTGVDAMIREAELEELQKQWAKENERIMSASQISDLGGTMTPLGEPAPEGQPAPEAAAGTPADAAPGQPGPPPEAPAADAPAPDAPALDAPKGTAAT